jgi:hypothetical protein
MRFMVDDLEYTDCLVCREIHKKSLHEYKSVSAFQEIIRECGFDGLRQV